MKVHILKSDFRSGAPKLEQLPLIKCAEIAMLGRSNAGKSTFINCITGRRSLARASATPGRTREINLYDLALKDGGNKNLELVLADLPGFGFAKFSKEKREDLSMETVRYLQERENLKMVCLINDCKRLPEADELAVYQLSRRLDLGFILVLSKIDKLKQKEVKKQVARVVEAYSIDMADVVLASLPGTADAFWERCLALCAD
jgi:GTP-binding protein